MVHGRTTQHLQNYALKLPLLRQTNCRLVRRASQAAHGLARRRETWGKHVAYNSRVRFVSSQNVETRLADGIEALRQSSHSGRL